MSEDLLTALARIEAAIGPASETVHMQGSALARIFERASEAGFNDVEWMRTLREAHDLNATALAVMGKTAQGLVAVTERVRILVGEPIGAAEANDATRRKILSRVESSLESLARLQESLFAVVSETETSADSDAPDFATTAQRLLVAADQLIEHSRDLADADFAHLIGLRVDATESVRRDS